MQKYRSVAKKLVEIEAGTPVGMAEGKVGILTQVAQDPYNPKWLVPRLNIWTGREWLQETRKGMPPDTEFDVLTGRKASELRELMGGYAAKQASRLMAAGTYFDCGTDPEVFAVRGDGTLFPAYEFLPCKAKRDDIGKKTYDPVDIHAPFWDGFQAEFTTIPNSCVIFLMDEIRKGLKATLQAAKKVDPQARLTTKSVFEIPQETLDNADIEHIMLGCMPSKNVYGAKGAQVSDPRLLRHRFAGFHVHLGGHRVGAQATKMIRAIDAIAGVAGVGMFDGMDDPVRRKFYGLAGEYRSPDYGLEYRTFSSSVLVHPAITNLVYDLVKLSAWASECSIGEYWVGDKDETQRVINEGDVRGARKIVEKNCALLRAIMEWRYDNMTVAGGKKKCTREEFSLGAIKVIMDGVGSIMHSTDDVSGAWMLETEYPDAPYEYKPQDYTDRWGLHCESRNRQWHKAAGEILKGVKL